ncbi:hypothetical protein, partial [Microbulbifer pacificus]|uniref:hypothetical protein n=1 Tax=Microbulbifer pacificus TaxID=407164 RepID=UPI001F1E0362
MNTIAMSTIKVNRRGTGTKDTFIIITTNIMGMNTITMNIKNTVEVREIDILTRSMEEPIPVIM